jgi:hypothetical protein
LCSGTGAPDVFIDLLSIRGDVDEQIFYTSFFTGGGLGMILCPGCSDAAPAPRNTWSNASSLQRIMLDLSIGQGFEAQAVDVNNDGILDLLVTNHVDNGTESGVFVYEAPPVGVPLTNVNAWKTLIWDCAGTAGRQAAADVDGDGCQELFAPCYDSSIIHVFRVTG